MRSSFVHFFILIFYRLDFECHLSRCWRKHSVWSSRSNLNADEPKWQPAEILMSVLSLSGLNRLAVSKSTLKKTLIAVPALACTSLIRFVFVFHYMQISNVQSSFCFNSYDHNRKCLFSLWVRSVFSYFWWWFSCNYYKTMAHIFCDNVRCICTNYILTSVVNVFKCVRQSSCFKVTKLSLVSANGQYSWRYPGLWVSGICSLQTEN